MQGEVVENGSAPVPMAVDSQALPFGEATMEAQERQQKLLQHLQQQRMARTLVLPTDDNLVQARLRELSEPVCLFAEEAPERRERLRRELAARGDTQGMPSSFIEAQRRKQEMEDKVPTGTFYYAGDVRLLEVRQHVAITSLHAAQERLRKEKRERERNVAELEAATAALKLPAFVVSRHAEEQRLRRFAPSASMIASRRPISSCALDRDGVTMATTDWDGVVSVWNVERCERVRVFQGHVERAHHCQWYARADAVGAGDDDGARGDGGDTKATSSKAKRKKKARKGSKKGGVTAMQTDTTTDDASSPMQVDTDALAWPQEPGVTSTLSLATAGADRLVKLWDAQGQALASLKGHMTRVNRVAFHPHVPLLASTSHDCTWRLWDLTRQESVLVQEGHSEPVYPVAWHPDGSLACTGDLASIVRVWDIRSGKTVLVLRGHTRQVLSADFHCNGWQLATGSEDNTVRIWDLRAKSSLYTIPAHTNMVSCVRFEPNSGAFLASASFDCTARLWSTSTWTQLATLQGHDGRVVGLDIAPGGKRIVSSSFDKTIKVWTEDDLF